MKNLFTITQEINNVLPIRKGRPALASLLNPLEPDEQAILVSMEETHLEIFEGELYDAPTGDYYGEFHGGHPWICDRLLKYAEANNLFIEWYDPGGLHITKN